MPFSYSLSSRQKLETADPKLRAVFNEVIRHVDCTITEGARTDELQKMYFEMGRSKRDGVTKKSKHQTDEGHPLSSAIDAAPYFADEYPKIPYEDRERMLAFAFYVKGLAAGMGISLRIGADWDGDFTFTDQSFHDTPHFELDDA